MPRVVVLGSSNTDMTVRMPRLAGARADDPGQHVFDHPRRQRGQPGRRGPRAGAEVVFVTAVGNDDLGKQALELYQREGIDVSHVRVLDGVASGVAMIFVGEDGENMIGVAPGANQKLMPADVDQPARVVVSARMMCCWSAWRSRSKPRSAPARGFEAGMCTILNPAPAPAAKDREIPNLLSATRIVTPNRGEALALAGMAEHSGPEPDWEACGSRLRAMGPAAVVITLGSLGCQVIASETWSVAAPRVEAVDTVGAGDAFNGAMAAIVAEEYGKASSRGLTTRMVAWANAAAALAVTQPGAQSALPYRAAIDELAGRSSLR